MDDKVDMIPTATIIEIVAQNQRLKKREHFLNKLLLLVILILVITVFLLSKTINDMQQSDKKKMNETTENPEKMLKETIDLKKKASEARTKLKELKCLNEVPEQLMDKWIPDRSKFQGAEELLELHGYAVDQKAMFESRPIFKTNKQLNDSMTIQWNVGNLKLMGALPLTGDCKHMENRNGFEIFLKDGDLHICQPFYLKEKGLVFTRVYYIPDNELVQEWN